MKNNNLSIVLNVVLLFAVVILFYLHFSSRKAIEGVAELADSTKLSFHIPKNLSGAKVLYVHTDSINKNYDAIKELNSSEMASLEEQYVRYQNRVANYQRRYELLNGGKWPYSADSAIAEEKLLGAEEKALLNLQNYIAGLESKAMEKNAMVIQDIQMYFKDYSKQKGIDYIVLIGGENNPFIYANDSLNISTDVVNALNANYRKNKDKNLIQAPK